MLLKMQQSKLSLIKKQKKELQNDQKQRLYSKLNNSHDHERFDLIYSENYY
jgi:hypothetical protein